MRALKNFHLKMEPSSVLVFYGQMEISVMGIVGGLVRSFTVKALILFILLSYALQVIYKRIIGYNKNITHNKRREKLCLRKERCFADAKKVLENPANHKNCPYIFVNIL